MSLRHGHAAWQLLCSRRAPLVLACLKELFREQSEILQEDVVQHLGEIFVEYANVEEFEIKTDEAFLMSRKELREWIKRKLVVEREGRVSSTDALQRAMAFVDGLEDRTMSSTASRLSVVQREIEALEAAMNPQKEQRAALLKKKIAEMERELAGVEAGNFQVLEGRRGVERVREVYQLAMGLKADFRRVEDSYREADRKLRRQITRSDQDRSAVLDRLLDSHEELLATAEGQVFDSFYEQLQDQVPLDEMKLRVREILKQPCAAEALDRRQRSDLQWLVGSLVRESHRVIEARARGERDVKSYVKTGLASENFRVGMLVNELLDAAAGVDWESAKVRRMGAMLPPLAVQVRNLPLVQRLVVHEAGEADGWALDLQEAEAQLDGLGEDFWRSLHGLNRQELFSKTLARLRAEGREMTLGELADLCQAEHDLETVAYWVSLACEAGGVAGDEREKLRVMSESGSVEFDVPLMALDAAAVERVDADSLG